MPAHTIARRLKWCVKLLPGLLLRAPEKEIAQRWVAPRCIEPNVGIAFQWQPRLNGKHRLAAGQLANDLGVTVDIGAVAPLGPKVASRKYAAGSCA